MTTYFALVFLFSSYMCFRWTTGGIDTPIKISLFGLAIWSAFLFAKSVGVL